MVALGETMASITLKNIPDTLFDRLKASAELHRRSLNSEVLFNLERALGATPSDVTERLARARRLREKTASYRISDKEITGAKRSGRS